MLHKKIIPPGIRIFLKSYSLTSQELNHVLLKNINFFLLNLKNAYKNTLYTLLNPLMTLNNKKKGPITQNQLQNK